MQWLLPPVYRRPCFELKGDHSTAIILIIKMLVRGCSIRAISVI